MPGAQKQFFIDWYKEQGRNFPWRQKNVSSFHLLITEMLLRQTRAMQVARLWTSFTDKYPSPNALGKADCNELFDQVKELGFGNQRVEALTSASRHLLERYNGAVPQDKKELLAVPHVGPYTAHAVRCFAFEQAEPVVDTNVLRLLARLQLKNVQQPDIRRNSWAWDMASAMVPNTPDEAACHNYGLLDFTAQVCKPRSPQCEKCPLSRECAFGIARLRGEEITPPW